MAHGKNSIKGGSCDPSRSDAHGLISGIPMYTGFTAPKTIQDKKSNTYVYIGIAVIVLLYLSN